MRHERRNWYWGALITGALAIAVTVAFVITSKAESGQFTLRMRPVPPLTMAECIAEAARYGYSTQGASQVCSLAKGRSWYHAVLSNNGGDAYPLCSAKAFDSSGTVVFSRPLVFDFGGIPGLYVHGHHSVSFSWYLPNFSRPVARYLATCSVNNNPPI